MSVPVLTAAEGANWESDLIARLARGDHDILISRRCVDIVDLLAVAACGQGEAALVDAQLRKLDADAVDRLTASGLAVVAVTGPNPLEDEERLRNLGVSYFVPAEADVAVVAAVLRSATNDLQVPVTVLVRLSGRRAHGRSWLAWTSLRLDLGHLPCFAPRTRQQDVDR